MLYLAIAVIFAACGPFAAFLVSNSVLVAEITAKEAKQGKTKCFITLKVLNAASPERLIPPKKIYVVWAVSESGITRNVGHL
jgi:hypothetical protein